MEFKVKDYEEVDSWQTIILLYNSALKEVGTKLEILNDEFQHIHQYNPIEHIKSRIKTPESIVKKLKKRGCESTLDNMVKYVNDIAGIRIICSFTSDIYRIAEMLRNQSELSISIKDYIKHPKKADTKFSYACICFDLPFRQRKRTKWRYKSERCMDFWASLDIV